MEAEEHFLQQEQDDFDEEMLNLESELYDEVCPASFSCPMQIHSNWSI
jgi:hypothetical protein